MRKPSQSKGLFDKAILKNLTAVLIIVAIIYQAITLTFVTSKLLPHDQELIISGHMLFSIYVSISLFSLILVIILISIGRDIIILKTRIYLFFISTFLLICLANYYAQIFSLTGLKCTFDPNYNPRGIDYLYFSVITLTTVGYGDFVPLNANARAAAGSEAIFGYIVLVLTVNALSKFKVDA